VIVLEKAAHALSEWFLDWDSMARIGTQKKGVHLNTIVKEQGLECPNQDAFFTQTLQVK
jgi:hypothetical protein